MIYRVSLMPKDVSSSQYLKSAEITRIGKTKAASGMGISADGSWLVVLAGSMAYVSSILSADTDFVKFASPERLTCIAFHPTERY